MENRWLHVGMNEVTRDYYTDDGDYYMVPSEGHDRGNKRGVRGVDNMEKRSIKRRGERKDEWSRKVIEESSQGGIRRAKGMENTAG